MVSSSVSRAGTEPAITGVIISTVVPGKARGETEDRAVTNTDLAVKLHYIRGVYFFNSGVDPAAGMPSTPEMKAAMFELLDRFFVTAGRVRRSDGGDRRPYIKCNDAGVRIVEAFCDKTVDEWLSKDLAMEELGFDDRGDCHGGLCYDQVLGPDLGFSPLVYIQFTRFKCGGLSVGLSWAHLLGDVQSALAFINTWAQIMAGHVPNKSVHMPSCPKVQEDSTGLAPKKAMSLKQLESVGDHWLITANNGQKMRAHSFRVTSKQIGLLISNACGEKSHEFSEFEMLSAVIWKSLSRIRNNLGPKIVTICYYDYSHREQHEIPNNKSMVWGTVESDPEIDVSELAFRIAGKKVVENATIEETVGKKRGEADYSLYGANLTFVNLEEADIYGLELNGQKLIFANYTIAGVGDI